MVNDGIGNGNFTTLKPFAFWTQHVLPLVYGDEISYMETLGKMRDILNELIKNNNNLPDYIQQMIEAYISSGAIEEVIDNILASFILNVKFPPTGIPKAKGDGTTNDHDSIQGCIDYAAANGGGIVYLPAGKYLTSPLVLKSGVTLLGFGRYAVSLVLAGGATTHLITGTVSDAGLVNLTLDAKMSSQVNRIDAVELIGNHIDIKNIVARDCYTSINIQKDGTAVNISSVICEIASDACLRIGGTDGGLLVDGLEMTGLSTNLGTAYIVTDSNGDIYRNINIHGTGAIGIDVSGSGNYFDGKISGVTKDYDDISGDNTFNLFGKTRVENLTGEVVENANAFSQTAVNGIERQGANISDNAVNTHTINAKDVVLNPTNPLTYKAPLDISNLFKYVPMKDSSGNEYKVLVGGEGMENISQYPLYKDFNVTKQLSGNTVNSLKTNVITVEIPAGNMPKIYSNFGNAIDIVEMSKETKANAGINGAIYGSNFTARGINIVNGVIISDEKMTGYTNVYTLAFKEDGKLDAFLTNDTSASELLAQGYNNAVQGWTALMINGVETPNDETTAKTTGRSAIGQKPDGTYVLLASTCNDNNVGIDYPTIISILRGKGCTFIYSLDGGGSSQLAYKNINMLEASYDKTYRKVPNFIYFDSLNVNADYSIYYELGLAKKDLDERMFTKFNINNIVLRILNTQDTNAGIEFFNNYQFGIDNARSGKTGVDNNGCYYDFRDSSGYATVFRANKNGIQDSSGALAKYYVTAPDATDLFYNLSAGEYYFRGNTYAPGLPDNLNYVGTISKSGNYVQAIMKPISFSNLIYYCVSSGGSQKYYSLPLTELTL